MKGGVIGVVVGIILNIIMIFEIFGLALYAKCLNLSDLDAGLVISGVPLYCSILAPGAYLGSMGIFVFFIGWFVYGAIIGWIVEKVR